MLEPVGGGWRRSHLISDDTAALLARYTHPGTLDPEVESTTVARLVLDGILEIEWQGGFRSGPETHPRFFTAVPAPPDGPLGRCSLDALQIAEAAGGTDPRAIADRLYRFNSRPASPAWRRRLSDMPLAADFSWQIWNEPRASMPEAGDPTFKLYVSPDPGHTAEACRALLSLMGLPRGPFAMKVGRDQHTVLRPDKLVAYFTSLDGVQDAATRLGTALTGMPAHGVPFTVGLTEDGLMSWAADPTDSIEPPGPRRRESWRTWVTDHLATAMASALDAGAPVPAWHYALDRVALDGVDPGRWAPPDRFTRRADRRSDADH